MMSPIASFHLIRVRRAQAPLAMARLATDRRSLNEVAGLRFFRLLGTARGRSVTWSPAPTRTALFAVWDDESALDDFLARHRVARRWQHAQEAWHARLRQVDGHGDWSGFPVSAALDREQRTDGPVVVLTRANVAARSWPPFVRQSRLVSEQLSNVEGLLDVVGVGEATDSAERHGEHLELPRCDRPVRNGRFGASELDASCWR